jgi:hypothetical protein
MKFEDLRISGSEDLKESGKFLRSQENPKILRS